LGAALKNSEADATVELRWDGELEMPPIDLPARPLVLRAAKQARPIWIHGDPSSDALVAHAPLTLKGIEFRFGSTNSAERPANEVRKPTQDGRPEIRAPGRGALIRLIGNSLNVDQCVLRNLRDAE